MNFINGNKATILIHDTIDAEMANEITTFVYGLEFLDDVTDLEVSINSPGGSVMAGFSIYSALKASTKKTNSTIEFISASIATIVMLGTDTLTANDYSNIMIHNPFGGSEKVLDKVKDSIMTIYGDKFGKNVAQLMEDETWFGGKDIINLHLLGVLDTIIYTENETMKFTENDVSEIMELSNSIIKNKFDNMLENNEEEVVEVENTEMVENETTETVENETEVEVEAEVETEVEVEAVEEAVEEVLEVENAVNIEELLNEIKNLKEENEEMKTQLGVISESKIKEEKLEILSNSAIEEGEYENWMNLEIDVIKTLTNSIKKDIKTPKIVFDNKAEDLKFSELSNEQKEDLKETNYAEYSRLFFENK